MCQTLCFVLGTFRKLKYVWRDDIYLGYVEEPDSFGSIVGIFMLSSAVDVMSAVVVVLVVLELPSSDVLSFSLIY